MTAICDELPIAMVEKQACIGPFATVAHARPNDVKRPKKDAL
jgi:hypothetical protein